MRGDLLFYAAVGQIPHRLSLLRGGVPRPGQGRIIAPNRPHHNMLLGMDEHEQWLFQRQAPPSTLENSYSHNRLWQELSEDPLHKPTGWRKPADISAGAGISPAVAESASIPDAKHGDFAAHQVENHRQQLKCSHVTDRYV
jgi:hypothetical protein